MKCRSYKKVKLSGIEIARCIEFCRQSAETQQAIEFGQRDTAPRDINEIAKDNFIGKLAEMAVVDMLRFDYGIHVSVNWEIYGIGEGDDCDMIIGNGWKVDVKSTKTGNWLLFDADKLKMRKNQKYNNLPDAIFMCRTLWDFENDRPTGEVELIGAVSLKSLLDPNCNVHRFQKGDLLPGTNTKLQADNYGIRFDDLDHNWGKNIKHMMENYPPRREELAMMV